MVVFIDNPDCLTKSVNAVSEITDKPTRIVHSARKMVVEMSPLGEASAFRLPVDDARFADLNPLLEVTSAASKEKAAKRSKQAQIA